MKKIDKLSKQFTTELKELPLVKEYNAVAKEYHASTELKDLEAQIRKVQTKMIMARENHHQEEFEDYKKQWEDYRNQHDQHPLYVNYINLRNEVEGLITELLTILNDLD